jgi:hypothetical protein
MASETIQLYEPLDTLKPVARDVWIADGPAVRFGYGGVTLPFPTRMTVVRLSGRRLFIHSPTALAAGLQAEIAREGAPAWLVGPNRLHYSWLPQWRQAYPAAEIWFAPRLKQQAGALIGFEGRQLDREDGYAWDAELATLPVVGRFMTEVVFFHRASRTLVLTDLIENFEPRRIGSRVMRWLVRMGAAEAPDGQMPRDMRLTYPRAELREAVERMIAWDPERVILAHGAWFESDGAARLRRAFRWLLD